MCKGYPSTSVTYILFIGYPMFNNNRYSFQKSGDNMKRKYIVSMMILAVFIITAFAGCIGGSTDWVIEEFDGDYDADKNTVLKVNNMNGNIEITVHDGDKVSLHVEKRVLEKYKEQLDKVEIEVTEEDDEILIETIDKNDISKHVSVLMTIEVPEDVKVESVETTNGNIVISGTKGDMTVKGTNGNIIVDDIDGLVEVSTTNGNIDIQDTNGIGNIDTTNGNIRVDINELNEDIDIGTVNGNIDVYILPTLDADISMETSNGSVTIHDLDLDLTTDKKTNKEGKLGEGGIDIDIHTSNSNIDLYELD